jgi:hypothetical protein
MNKILQDVAYLRSRYNGLQGRGPSAVFAICDYVEKMEREIELAEQKTKKTKKPAVKH